MASHSIAPIPVVARHFGKPDAPFVAEEYHPDRGWFRSGWRKRVSESYVRSLKAAGVERVALEYDGRVADFTVRELLASAVERRRPEPVPRLCRREACVDLAGGHDRVDHEAGSHG